MKTFNEKDLITWSNREKAVIGNEYYFDDTVFGLKNSLNENSRHKLIRIDDNLIDRPFIYKKEIGDCYFACILPVEAVTENKTYRPCKNLRELYLLIHDEEVEVADLLYKEEFIYDIIGKVIHFKWKSSDTTHYSCITGIAVYNNGDIAVHIDGCSFELPELFKSYEIEINGEWVPFGVEE